jgi:hypothetical protein
VRTQVQSLDWRFESAAASEMAGSRMNEPVRHSPTSSARRKTLCWLQTRIWLLLMLSLVATGKARAADADPFDAKTLDELPAVVPPSLWEDEQSAQTEGDQTQPSALPAAERNPQQSSRMTIRRDPSPDRLETYQALNSAKSPRVTAPPPHVFPWSNPVPYGQYLYIHHDPLLFEDLPAERYGESHCACVQPVVSFVKFVGTVPMLPYKIPMNYHAARHEEGYYAYDHHHNLRPGVVEGSYFPDLRPSAPYPKSRMKALATYAGVATGIVFFLP